MNALLFLIPVALLLGFAGLAAFIWALRSGQFEDLDGAAVRILIDDNEQTGAQETPARTEPPTERRLER